MDYFKVKFYPNGEFTVGRTKEKEIGLLDNTNSHKVQKRERGVTYSERKRAKQNKMTSEAKRLIRSAIYSLGDKKLCTYITLTVPKIGEGTKRELYKKADNIIRVHRQKLERALRKAGLPAEVVVVREFTKAGMVHWHCIFQGKKKKGTWAYTPKQLCKMWNSTLSKQLGEEIDSENSVDTRGLETSFSQAIELYFTKEGERLEEEIVGRGYNMTKTLKEKAEPS